MKTLNAILHFPIAGLFLIAGVSKFGLDPGSIELFEALGMDPFGRWTIGVLELLSAALLLAPRMTAAGALLGWGIMTGALIAHGTVLGVTGFLGIMALVAVAAWLGCGWLLFAAREEIGFIRCMFACEKNPGDESSS